MDRNVASCLLEQVRPVCFLQPCLACARLRIASRRAGCKRYMPRHPPEPTSVYTENDFRLATCSCPPCLAKMRLGHTSLGRVTNRSSSFWPHRDDYFEPVYRALFPLPQARLPEVEHSVKLYWTLTVMVDICDILRFCRHVTRHFTDMLRNL